MANKAKNIFITLGLVVVVVATATLVLSTQTTAYATEATTDMTVAVQADATSLPAFEMEALEPLLETGVTEPVPISATGTVSETEAVANADVGVWWYWADVAPWGRCIGYCTRIPTFCDCLVIVF